MSRRTQAPAEDVSLQATHFEVLGKSQSARVTYRLMRGSQVLGEVALHVDRRAFEQRHAAVRQALSDFARLLQKGIDGSPPGADA